MSTTTTPQILFAPHIVVVHDILNQGSLLMRWDVLPKADESGSEARQAMLDSVYTVKSVRTNFDGFRAGFNRPVKLPEDLQKDIDEIPNAKSELTALQSTTISSQSFSDTNIWFAPLRSLDGYLFSRTAFHIIAGTAFSHLLALSDRIPCRGGIDVGAATNAFPNEIYGPALLKAYQLESKVAQYPRIVVGVDLASYFGSIVRDLKMNESSSDFRDHIKTYHKTYINSIMDLIFVDRDGVFCVDFAGEKAASLFIPQLRESRLDPQSIFNSAIAFALESLKNFLSNRNHVLAARYDNLVSYLQSRVQFWK